MKFSIIAALGAASLVAAQDTSSLTSLPPCARDCALANTGSAPDCDILKLEITCFCDSSDFVNAIADCIATSGKCGSPEDIAAASAAALEMCPNSALVSSARSSIGAGVPTAAPNATINASGSATTTSSAASTSTGAAASILPGGFAAAALVAAIFAL